MPTRPPAADVDELYLVDSFGSAVDSYSRSSRKVKETILLSDGDFAALAALAMAPSNENVPYTTLTTYDAIGTGGYYRIHRLYIAADDTAVTSFHDAHPWDEATWWDGDSDASLRDTAVDEALNRCTPGTGCPGFLPRTDFTQLFTGETYGTTPTSAYLDGEGNTVEPPGGGQATGEIARRLVDGAWRTGQVDPATTGIEIARSFANGAWRTGAVDSAAGGIVIARHVASGAWRTGPVTRG